MISLYTISDVLRLGLSGLVVHKVRSVLAAMGIIFGVWSVIAMLAISEGASYQAQVYLRELGSSNILISSIKPSDAGSEASSDTNWIMSYGLTHRDVEMLRENLPDVVRSVKIHRTRKSAYHQGKKFSVEVLATPPELLKVAQADMKRGRFIAAADQLRRKPFCVIDAAFARKMFGYKDAIGKVIDVHGEPFQVIGIVRKIPEVLAGGAGTDVLIVPHASGMSRYGEVTLLWEQGGFQGEYVEVSQVIFQMADEDAVVQGAAIARSLLARQHDQVDYDVKVPLELLEQQEKQQRLWSIVFVVIAAVSLLVGGIGIMNIMLASVTERTREIGIRRALGAKKRDITIQFLVESVTLTAVGGLLGIGVGLGVPVAIERLLGFKTIITAQTLLLPFVTAVVSGILSGLYPAIRAAALDPIVALRHE